MIKVIKRRSYYQGRGLILLFRRFLKRFQLEVYRLFICRGFRHSWGGRELDLMQSLPGYRNPFLMICSKCGFSALREEDDY